MTEEIQMSQEGKENNMVHINSAISVITMYVK